MKITIYTITECKFSQQEKEYLTNHTLPFEEKNLETNREFLTEMLTVGNNFAGTPLTKIEKDDGQIVVLKGFTQAEFDKTLGLTVVEPVKSVEAVKPVESVTPSVETVPATPPIPVAPSPEPTMPQVETVPPTVQAPNEQMQSILNNLQQQAGTPAQPVQTAPPQTQPPTGAPVIPDPQF